jgi:myo-inositol 2-dehydrogenase / D-chiro-inositol 1-dehydrogenase
MRQANRRDFLFSSAAALSASQLKAEPGEEIRTAFIGVGARGSGLLKTVLEASNVRIKAICDINPQTRDEALTTAKRDNPRSVAEWKSVLDLKDVDAVFVATPCDMHAEMGAACLEAGKHVYLEKPLAITAEGVARVLKAARRSDAILQIGQQLRYYATVREAVRQIHSGELTGQTYIMKAHRHGGRSKPRGDEAAAEDPRAKIRRDWYADVRRSGDLIVENAVHNIDACNWIANSRPVSAYGHGKKYFPKPIPAGTVMMDGFSVEFIYENDVHCQYSQISFHPGTMKILPSGMWYTVYGEKGSVFMTHEEATYFDLYGESAPLDMLKNLTDKTDPNTGAVSDFYDSIRRKRQPFAGLQVAATAALTAIMAREAIYKGRSVTWKELGVEV